MAIVIHPSWFGIYLRPYQKTKEMKARRIFLITTWAITLLFSTVNAQVFSLKNYKLTISGTSSLHDFESTVENLEAKGSFVITGDQLSDIRDVVVKIPVKSIKSTKGKIMDNKTWEAFDYGKNPLITFTLTEKKINTDKNTITATGALTMAGVTKTINLLLTYKVLSGGELEITGSHKLVMSEYKMTPPTAMMGAIKVSDEVSVHFNILLTQTNSSKL
jgi:polyisoprenoid-binding protein YceI